MHAMRGSFFWEGGVCGGRVSTVADVLAVKHIRHFIFLLIRILFFVDRREKSLLFPYKTVELPKKCPFFSSAKSTIQSNDSDPSGSRSF